MRVLDPDAQAALWASIYLGLVVVGMSLLSAGIVWLIERCTGIQCQDWIGDQGSQPRR